MSFTLSAFSDIHLSISENALSVYYVLDSIEHCLQHLFTLSGILNVINILIFAGHSTSSVEDLKNISSADDESISNSSSPPPRKKKSRTVFTRQQIQHLENAFDRKKYFTNSERQKLATDLTLSETQVRDILIRNVFNEWTGFSEKRIHNHPVKDINKIPGGMPEFVEKSWIFRRREGWGLIEQIPEIL